MNINHLDGLPDRRKSLVGTDDRGDEIWLIRGISQKLYRCGSCRDAIEPGDDHVIVQYQFRTGGSEHSHWHRRCALEILAPQLRGLKAASSAESRPERMRGGRRGRRKGR
jgi:hypothetical protein